MLLLVFFGLYKNENPKAKTPEVLIRLCNNDWKFLCNHYHLQCFHSLEMSNNRKIYTLLSYIQHARLYAFFPHDSLCASKECCPRAAFVPKYSNRLSQSTYSVRMDRKKIQNQSFQVHASFKVKSNAAHFACLLGRGRKNDENSGVWCVYSFIRQEYGLLYFCSNTFFKCLIILTLNDCNLGVYLFIYSYSNSKPVPSVCFLVHSSNRADNSLDM